MSTFSASVVAVGVTSTGVASAAAPLPAILDGVPADIATQAPLRTCPALHEFGHGLEKAPCLDTDLGVSVPNPAKKSGLGRAADGVLGAAQRTDDSPPRMIGRVVPTAATANDLVRTRPTVDLDVRPDYPGVLEPKSGNGLLGARIGPHQLQQNGVSALDTAAKVDAIHGYNLRPGAMVRSLAGPTSSPTRPTGPGKALEGGLRTVVGALGMTLNAAQSIS